MVFRLLGQLQTTMKLTKAKAFSLYSYWVGEGCGAKRLCNITRAMKNNTKTCELTNTATVSFFLPLSLEKTLGKLTGFIFCHQQKKVLADRMNEKRA